MNEKIEKVLGAGQHGSTFGGNPVVCAGAIEVVRKVTDKDFLVNVVQKRRIFKRTFIVFAECHQCIRQRTYVRHITSRKFRCS